MDNETRPVDWESEYRRNYSAIEPPGFEHFWRTMGAEKCVPYDKETEIYWKARKWALVGWIASGQGWG